MQNVETGFTYVIIIIIIIIINIIICKKLGKNLWCDKCWMSNVNLEEES